MDWIRRARTLPGAVLVVTSFAAPVPAQEVEIATMVSMLEGPTVDAAGNVYFTDILLQRIMRFSADGRFSVFRDRSNIANGLVIDPQGRRRCIADGGAQRDDDRRDCSGDPHRSQDRKD
jgi:sugar lactone lactonase YvrE